MTFMNGLKKLKSSGKNRWLACCPVHDDKNPSMLIKQNPDNSYTINCYSCGANGVDVFEALGLARNDPELFGDRYNSGQSKGVSYKQQMEYDHDRYFSAIYESHKSKGDYISHADHKRYRLAKARMESIEAMTGKP